MYIYIYIHMYIHIRIYISISLSLYIYIYIICVYIYIYIYCIICIYVCMYVCMYIYIYIYIDSTKVLDFRGLDSGRISMSRGWKSQARGESPGDSESASPSGANLSREIWRYTSSPPPALFVSRPPSCARPPSRSGASG